MVSETLMTNGLLIGADLRPSGSGGTIDHYYPANGRINGIVTLGGTAEIADAVAQAEAALPAWEALGSTGRRDCLTRLADLLETRMEEFRACSMAEIGMPVQGFASRHAWSVNWIRMYAGYADKIGGDITASSDINGTLEYTRLEPYGVIGIIVTWNSALISLAMKIPAALAAGNTVVVKPSELTPYTALLFGQICLEAGIPVGVVNMVPGAREAGEAIVAHPAVEKISFTGGLATAQAMMVSGARFIKPFCFELGGKSAQVVFEDADVEQAARLTALSLANAGQSCVLGSRIFAHASVYDHFRAATVSHLEALKVGDPADAQTYVGPVVSAAARDRILSFCADAIDNRQGNLCTGGKAPVLGGALDSGYFVAPTLFDEVDPDSALYKDEVFGPVFTLNRFESEEEVVKAVNSTHFGLSNYIYTRDLKRAVRVTSRVKSGTVYVNNASRQNAGAPFGGYRQSGIGYEGGRPGLEEFLRRKTVGLA